MIKANQIKKSYGNLAVLKGIDLSIEKAEIVSIVGASGAGKTTLLQILGTLDQADSGLLEINGQDVSAIKGNALSAFRNSQLGFVFQFHQLLPEFTALENICMPAWIGKKNKVEAHARAIQLLDFLNIGHRSSHKPSEMSGGEQQRVAVARALMNQPAVIFADEPSGNLDSKNAGELHDLFFKLRDEFGQTFVIVTHNELLANRADRKLVIKDGVIE
jgi:lipoprotein-releasing system ATP-binding protein